MFTTLLMQSGLPKMMSRVLTCLYTTDASSLTASELVQRLQVSPASISKAITFLESQGLIRRERDERRRERYVVDNDVWYQRMIASARSHALKFRLSSKLMSPAKRPSGLTIQWPHRGSPASIETVPARGIRSGNPLGRL
ncbi:MarR family transcriptional regulator [Streptomyces sp. NPDC026206]|uniref:MarR family transcriptional regulator n=1 Tax=Streptomyces sp. NPDC026206 TaxID=3157089 RepID=UPI0033E9B607